MSIDAADKRAWNTERIEKVFLTGTRDEHLGVYNEIFAAKSTIDGQDGGLVTALLVSGMQRGLFDSAIVVQRIDGYKAEAVIAESIDDLIRAKGTKYLRVEMMPELSGLINKGKKKIALVSTACEVRAARIIQEKFPDVDITIIGLFCFEAFDYEKLKAETQKLLGVDLDKAEKTQIHKGNYIVNIEGKEYSTAVKDISSAIEKRCPYCDDFAAKLSDISVGSVGSEDGYSTVIVRSEKGKKLLEKLELTRENVNKAEIVNLSILKKNRAKKSFVPILRGIRVQPS